MLTPGRKVSHYRLLEQIGAGGRGVVWKAEDTVLGRQVAIKVLPAGFAHDREQLARFKREARLLAALSHPNIASIHGLEESEGVRCLVLELVPGETLAQRLAHGALPVGEALRVCLQVAGALEAAHGKGIIHRDLKPSNIKVTPDGEVKVLDFGLAKTLHQTLSADAISQGPTSILGQTNEGTVLGTTPYMSPEQARGHELDGRTDIWSFGCVLYEALTGVRAFHGGTTSDTIAKILGEEPDWGVLPVSIPETARDLLRRCLRKDVERRLRDFGDVRILLSEAIEAQPRSGMLVPRVLRTVGGWRGLAAGALLAIIAGAGSLFVWRQWWEVAPATNIPVMFDFTLPEGVALPRFRSVNQFDVLALSPDGSRLVFVGEREGRTQLYLRRMDQLRAEPIAGTEQGRSPFFSPDGAWVGFFAEGKVKKVPLAGGPVVTLGDAPTGLNAAWGSDGTIVFSDLNRDLSRVSEDGGEVEELTHYVPGQGEVAYYSPQFLPDGKTLLFTVDLGTRLDQRVEALSLQSGERKTVLQDAGPALYVPSGHLLFQRAGRANAVRFDLEHLQVAGSSVPILDDLWLAIRFQSLQVAISGTGSLAYVPEESMPPDRRLVWVDRNGNASPAADAHRLFLVPRLSPDGRRLAVVVFNERFGQDLWIYDLARETLTQLTNEGRSVFPLWTPDGKRVTYCSVIAGRRNIYWRPPDGRSPPERLTISQNWQAPYSWSPDGKTLLFGEWGPESGSDIWALKVGGGAADALRPLLMTKAWEDAARFSPDGRWMAYLSDEPGQEEIYVCEYPACEKKWRISNTGGGEPVWTPDGRELIFRRQDEFFSVQIDYEGGFRPSAPRLLFRGEYDQSSSIQNYDITPDGRRFLMIRSEPREAPARIFLVLNWFEELEKLLPTRTP